MRCIVLVLACLIAVPAYSTSPIETGVGDPIVTKVIELAKKRAINSENVNWTVVEQEVGEIIAQQPSESGRTQAIEHVVRALDDGHSFYRPPSKATPTSRGAGEVDSGMSRRERVSVPIASYSGNRRFGVLALNAWTGSKKELDNATSIVRAELIRAVSRDPCGIIIDLTWNQGGNMWPMMGGIAPLYDEGTVLVFHARDESDQIIQVQDDQLKVNGATYPEAAHLPPVRPLPRYVALILSNRTASSGEIVALGFRGQENVRTFGEVTAGQTTANWSTTLDNGGRLALASAHIADRTESIQRGPLHPDVRSESARLDAESWLASNCPKSDH